MEKYHKIKELGKGSYGKVALYKTNATNERRVIKKIIFKPQINSSNTYVVPQATQNEVLILAMLKHPNVIQYYDSFISKDTLCIVMEYALHGTLHDLLVKQVQSQQLLSQQTVLFVFAQIIMAIDYIHENNIIHRDIKSENVLITGSSANIIKLTDFGIAKILSDINGLKTSTQIGTSNYLAPEVCNGDLYGVKADIWALGCILYELCALKRMFEGSVGTIVAQITQGQVKQIDTKVYSNQIQDLINSLCEFDPDRRPYTNELMKNRLILTQVFSIQVNLGKFTNIYV